MGDRVNRETRIARLSRAHTSVTLHLAPSGRGSDLVQADPHWSHRSGPLALGVEQARPPSPPSARARALNGRQEHQEDSSWLLPSGLRPASAGGAGCLGCGRVLQPPGPVTAPQNCPTAAYSTASQPLPPPQGLYCGHIAPPPTGSRAGARRARLGARTAAVRSNEYCRPAASSPRFFFKAFLFHFSANTSASNSCRLSLGPKLAFVTPLSDRAPARVPGVWRCEGRPPLPHHFVCVRICLLYTSPSPRDVEESRMPSSA